MMKLKAKENTYQSGIWKKVLLAVCIVTLISGGLLARYISSNQRQAEMIAAQFHISSDYLEEEGKNAQYTVKASEDGFDIHLYNYEKENEAQISGVEMKYTVAAENAAVTVKDKSGNAVAAVDSGLYSFAKSEEGTYQTIHVTPNDSVKNSGTITVTVTTTAPFTKTLKATFTIQGGKAPEYTIADKNDGTVLITVKTNDYKEQMTVQWNSAKYSPDNTNNLMEGWAGSNTNSATGFSQGTFTADPNSTYQLLFFKKTDATVTPATTGSGTMITLD